MTSRLRGTLERLTDDERRPLRPIGMSVREAAARTGELLERLSGVRGVRLFAGVRVAASAPRIGFAVSTTTHLLLVESVAWPAGAYTIDPQGAVLCDGTYIGQSVRPLVGAVGLLRRQMRRRAVGAIVVVHPSGRETPGLPPRTRTGPAWLPPGDVCSHVARTLLLLRRGPLLCQSDVNSVTL